ncbi:MAG: translational GTPase TypA [Deferribacteraceae bacterium]|jgi:GTP-binding protein|nr:translational GTPase TypA [Deferribacteraceae bacterium]
MKNRSINAAAIRNIAIIAHVDHGKTTLVDAMFKQCSIFRANQTVQERVLDSMELERERGITIAAKNCAVCWNGVRINIVDTPGHADFGGEVERALSMADGAILLVDCSEGPLPQTRFVLKKALEKGLRIIVVINKIDRKDMRAKEVLDEILDLFIDLDASDSQLEFPLLYAVGKSGIAQKTLTETGKDLAPLFEMIIEEIPSPVIGSDPEFSILVSDIGYSDYLGRLIIGKIYSGSVHPQDNVVCIKEDGVRINSRVTKVQLYDGLNLVEVQEANAGEIVVLFGIAEAFIGDTVASPLGKPLARLRVDEPTVVMKFGANTSPFAGQAGKLVQSARIKERLESEALRNVAIQVGEAEEKETYLVKGRGEFQLAILIETMRRQGYELTVGRAEVILKRVNGKLCEPIENLFIDCDEAFLGIVTEKLSMRKGRLMNLVNKGFGRVRAEFSIPSRGLIGYRDDFMTDTKGTGIMNSLFAGYEEHRGDFPTRWNGSLVSDRAGVAVAYGLFHLEPRGRLFVSPQDRVYEGMVIGEYNKETDIEVNPCKEKKLTNMRAAGKDDNIILRPIKPLTLEEALHFLAEDELLEVTPKAIRIRKAILSSVERRSAKSKSMKKIVNDS